ncbi:hypothetical protein RPC_3710 [Rhodopseudomonas palustris BisB18]|uniref:Uncharacterized protein n=1 Tax=Rhodopseudomonas palustris (strain BisB18) TaxID=316056 RepID=Q210E1_RHOPB
MNNREMIVRSPGEGDPDRQGKKRQRQGPTDQGGDFVDPGAGRDPRGRRLGTPCRKLAHDHAATNTPVRSNNEGLGGSEAFDDLHPPIIKASSRST